MNLEKTLVLLDSSCSSYNTCNLTVRSLVTHRIPRLELVIRHMQNPCTSPERGRLSTCTTQIAGSGPKAFLTYLRKITIRFLKCIYEIISLLQADPDTLQWLEKADAFHIRAGGGVIATLGRHVC